jgi:hypothetical protein
MTDDDRHVASLRSRRVERSSALQGFQTSTPCRSFSRCSALAMGFGPPAVHPTVNNSADSDRIESLHGRDWSALHALVRRYSSRTQAEIIMEEWEREKEHEEAERIPRGEPLPSPPEPFRFQPGRGDKGEGD